ncbi:MAG: DUF192 domain-containing protein [Kiritimatiellae bacterium]|nr:DUF192 domain-containing protein [Kiritimatiellia bacterium]
MRVGKLFFEGEVFAEPVEYARGFFERLKGLLGRVDMCDGAAMIIEHCGSVHTLGMSFAIDLIFLDREWRVVSLERDIPPGRWMITGGLRAKRVVESRAGALACDQLEPGSQLEFRG